ncbi:hypothetical protein [Rhodopirellula europaea]|uniref:hypothetical protein n=1 Tax=Rhodopirellula europaea TaxID=1263866 RepID=UPI001F1E65A7|nr:hypothetical protein [Rhodopirellula europaea]
MAETVSTDLGSIRDGETAPEFSAEQRAKAAKRAWLWSNMFVLSLFALIFFGGLLLSLYLHQPKPPPKPLPTPPIVLPPIDDELGPVPTAEIQRAVLSLAKVSVSLEAATLETKIPELKASFDALRDLRSSTLKDESGRRIAANEQHLAQFYVLQLLDKGVTPEELQSVLRQAVADNRTESDQMVVNSIIIELANACEQAHHWTVEYVKRRQTLDELIRRSISNAPASITLAEALQSRSQSLVEKKNRQIQEALNAESQRLSEDRTLVEDELKNQDKAVARLRQQIRSLESGGQPTNSPAQSDAPHQASLEEYQRDLPKIRSLLQPFITPGYMQPKSADEFAYAINKTPMSHSALTRSGALAAEPQGLITLFFIGGSKSATQNNDRPLGGFPRMNAITELSNSEDISARVSEAQLLLQIHGQRLVDNGLLAP